MLMPLQGVTNGCALTQGVASLALGYALVGLCLSASRRRPLAQPVLAYINVPIYNTISEQMLTYSFIQPNTACEMQARFQGR